jgi:hypothetical protein
LGRSEDFDQLFGGPVDGIVLRWVGHAGTLLDRSIIAADSRSITAQIARAGWSSGSEI